MWNPKPKRIFVFLGYDLKDSFSGFLADEYERAAREAGHEVRRMNLGDMQFDPILHKGYREIQPLEPDLLKVQENIKWCNHFVAVYPVWWSAMPARFKGMFDRMWLPGFAYKFSPRGVFWKRLLKGRTARIILMMDTYPMILRLAFGDYTNELRRAILWFAGFSPIRTMQIGHTKFMTPKRAARYARKVARYGRHGV
jgi:NAD(P)H dehydrogenase (quinone)